MSWILLFLKRLSLLYLTALFFNYNASALEIHDTEFQVSLTRKHTHREQICAEDQLTLILSIKNEGSRTLLDSLARVFLADNLKYLNNYRMFPTIDYNSDLHMLSVQVGRIEPGKIYSISFDVILFDHTNGENIKTAATGSAFRRIGNSLVHVTNWSNTVHLVIGDNGN